MNQYDTRCGLPNIEAKKLLRIALFSDTLKLSHNHEDTLLNIRRRLAYRLRIGRKQGLVPIFIGSIWFLFGMGTSPIYMNINV
jgi:hypothetical protein